jgi:hypothetical protein
MAGGTILRRFNSSLADGIGGGEGDTGGAGAGDCLGSWEATEGDGVRS